MNSDAATQDGLKRGLTARHIRFIALGSAIGTGLFYGSAEAIKRAGPSVLLAYLIGGIAVYLVLRALGEMAVRNPVSGSFSEYANKHLGPLAGFMTGWTYTFEMVIVCLADVTAFGFEVAMLIEDDAGIDLRVAGDWVKPWEVDHPAATAKGPVGQTSGQGG